MYYAAFFFVVVVFLVFEFFYLSLCNHLKNSVKMIMWIKLHVTLACYQ